MTYAPSLPSRLERPTIQRTVRLDNPASETAIIYSAGNGGFVDSEGTSRMAARLAEVTGADIILYDYPGRGTTTMPPTIEATSAFGPAMMDILKSQGWIGRRPVYKQEGANHAATASRTPRAFITRSSVSSVGFPLSLNAL